MNSRALAAGAGWAVDEMASENRVGRGYRGLGRDVWWISLSAFFADMGYQMVIAGLPLFLVLTLGAPTWLFGLATAVAYGGGALMGYLGGRFGDRFGRKRIAIIGNLLIPLLSLTALSFHPAVAVVLFVLGWWARNFRTPARRAMLSEAVPKDEAGTAYGLLHALDVGGGMLAAMFLVGLVLINTSFRVIFLITMVPLAASTLCLAATRVGGGAPDKGSPRQAEPQFGGRADRRLFWGVIASAALYGFSSYSIGFPILTVAQGTHQEAAGAGA
jgi:MFS family permease